MNRMEVLLKNLKKRNFKAEYYPTGIEAKSAILEHIASQESVDIGGSMTILEMGVQKELQERGNKVFWHWLVEADERDETRKKQQRQMHIYQVQTQ